MPTAKTTAAERDHWLRTLEKLARPVLTAQAKCRPHRDMPVVLGAE